MRNSLLPLIAFTIPVMMATASNADDQAKSIKLFNGKNLEGWTAVSADSKTKADDVWSAADGVLICQGKPNGYLRTKEKHKNYELSLQWRWKPSEEKVNRNSGVLLRMAGEDKVWPKSVEAQLMAGNAGDFWNFHNFKMRGDPSRTKGAGTKKAKASNEKKLGDWNQYRIVADQGNVKLYVNDELQNEATDVEEVAGPIGLQSEGAEIHFRNIELKPLD